MATRWIPPTVQNLTTAIVCNRHLDDVKGLVEGGCKPTTKHFNIAVQMGRLDIMKHFTSVVEGEYQPTPEHLDIAIQKGHTDCVKYLVGEGGCQPTAEHLEKAIHKECISIVMYLVTEGKCKPTAKQLDIAVKMHHSNIVKYLVAEGGCKLTVEYLDNAIRKGSINVVKCLVTEGKCEPSAEQLDIAVKMNHSNIVKYLVTEGGCKPTTEHFDYGVQLGISDIVKYLVAEGGYQPTASHLHIAIQQGYISIVKYLVTEGGCQPTAEHLDGAIYKGCIDIVKCLVTEGKCKPTTKQLDSAVSMNHSNIVKCLVAEGGCQPTAEHLHTAIQRRCISIVEYLVDESGCKPTAEHLNTAIQKEYIIIVKYLVTKGGCQPTAEHLHTAIQRMCISIVEYLVDESGCKPTAEHLNTAIQKEYIPIIVKYLVTKGGCQPTAEHLHTAIQRRCISTVDYLVDEGECKPTAEHLDIAIQKGYISIVEYLIDEGGCQPTAEHLDSAIHKGHIDIVKCLVTEGKCKPTAEQLDTAVSMNHPNIVKYLVAEGGCQTTAKHLHTAIQNGYISIVGYLVGYKPTTEHFDCAILLGNSDVVKYLVAEYGYTPTAKHLNTAILKGYTSIVKYLVTEARCKPTTKHFCLAIQLGNSDILKHLVAESESLTEYLDITIRNGHLDIVKYLVAECGCMPTATHLSTAIQKRYLDIVKYLVAEGGCKLTIEHLDAAFSREHFDVVICLVQCGCKVNTEHFRFSIENGYIHLVNIILASKYFDPSYRVHPCQRNALHIACAAGKVGFAKYLLQNGCCDINEKDGDGQTALDLSNTPEIIKELIKYGANVSNVYKRFGSVLGNAPRQPIEAPVKVFVAGDSRGGKSTLTKSLQKEISAFARVFSRRRKVSGVDEKTAGIIPYDFESKQYGSVIFYDLAGQREFYSSHAATLSNTICSSPPIFLLVIDLQKNEEEMKSSILYWLSFLENQCSLVNGRPHLVIIGSHADILKSRGEDPKQKGDIVKVVLSQSSSTWFKFSGFIPMDCQYPQSSNIGRLRYQLDLSCKALRITSTIQFNCHCFLVYLIDNYSDCPAVTLQKIKDHMSPDSDQINPINFVPPNLDLMLNMCEQLNDRGHILFLKNQTRVKDSWIIIDKAALLSEVTGTMFAPEDFKQHCKLASSTGVVPLSEIIHHFPKHSSDMLISFFSHLEFCSEICDHETLILIQKYQSLRKIMSVKLQRVEADSFQANGAQSSSPYIDRYFLFPGLIKIDRPDKIWEASSPFIFQCGWMLQCSQQTQFFSSRFLQVLLLRIAFAFALAPHREELDPDVPALQRKCSIWRNGIMWGNRNGAELLLEVIEHKTVIVLMRSQYLTGECLQLRSSIISKVLKTATEFCPKVSTNESFINPSETLHYPAESVLDLEQTHVSISEVAASVSSAEVAVVTTTGKSLLLERLLTFEPYAKLSPLILQSLFDESREEEEVTDEFLNDFAHAGHDMVETNLMILQKCLNVKTNELMCRIDQEPRECRDNPVRRCFLLLKIWKNQIAHPTLQSLRRVLDKHSVFGGRNPIELGGINSLSCPHSDTLCKDGVHRQETEGGELEPKLKGEDQIRSEEGAEEKVKNKPREVIHYEDLASNTNSDARSQLSSVYDQTHPCSVKPGTFSQFFVLDDLGFLMESLCQAAPQWYYIGLQLGVHPNDLNNIHHSHSLFIDSPKSYLREMLKTWLLLASPKSGSLTALLSALKSKTVREIRLAKTVERKSMEYLQRKWNESAQEKVQEVVEEVSREEEIEKMKQKKVEEVEEEEEDLRG